jgi:hypothetical protein
MVIEYSWTRAGSREGYTSCVSILADNFSFVAATTRFGIATAT